MSQQQRRPGQRRFHNSSIALNEVDGNENEVVDGNSDCEDDYVDSGEEDDGSDDDDDDDDDEADASQEVDYVQVLSRVAPLIATIMGRSFAVWGTITLCVVHLVLELYFFFFHSPGLCHVAVVPHFQTSHQVRPLIIALLQTCTEFYAPEKYKHPCM